MVGCFSKREDDDKEEEDDDTETDTDERLRRRLLLLLLNGIDNEDIHLLSVFFIAVEVGGILPATIVQ